MARLTIAAVLLLCTPLCATGLQSAIAGRIADSEGAAIAGARLLIHWDPSGSVGLPDNFKQDLIVVTGHNGEYTATVPSGFYDVFVSAPGFTPAAAKVRIKRGQKTRFAVELKADPLVGKELGDTFSISK
jgi:carboxypeptidase family protein